MRQAIVRVFDVYDHAEEARKALLADGFDRDEISFQINNDEAGPVEGNFTVGNLPTESQQHTYAANYANIEQRGQCTMIVQAMDEAMGARALAILERCGGRDPDPAARYGK